MKRRNHRYFWPLMLALFFLSTANNHAGKGGWLAIVLPGILLFLALKIMTDCFPIFGRTIGFLGRVLRDILFFPRQKKTKDKTRTGARSMQPRINFRR